MREPESDGPRRNAEGDREGQGVRRPRIRLKGGVETWVPIGKKAGR